MRIKKSIKFQNKFKIIFEYIAKDKYSAATSFRKELNELLKDLNNFPFKYRKSIYFNDENIRDMIFRGYTIIYELKYEESLIEILTIFNQNKKR